MPGALSVSWVIIRTDAGDLSGDTNDKVLYVRTLASCKYKQKDSPEQLK